jgi:hypothetical protein
MHQSKFAQKHGMHNLSQEENEKSKFILENLKEVLYPLGTE